MTRLLGRLSLIDSCISLGATFSVVRLLGDRCRRAAAVGRAVTDPVLFRPPETETSVSWLSVVNVVRPDLRLKVTTALFAFTRVTVSVRRGRLVWLGKTICMFLFVSVLVISVVSLVTVCMCRLTSVSLPSTTYVPKGSSVFFARPRQGLVILCMNRCAL